MNPVCIGHFQLTIGKTIKGLCATNSDNIVVEFDKNGPVIYICINNLSDQEKDLFIETKGEVRINLIDSIFVLSLKMGDIIPFTNTHFNIQQKIDPQFPFDLSHIYKKGTGLPVLLVLVEGITRKIVALRLINTPHEFANYLFRSLETQQQKLYNKEIYDFEAKRLFQKWNPFNLAKQAPVCYKF